MSLDADLQQQPESVEQPAATPAPLLEAIHPAVIATFQLLASIAGLVAFSPLGVPLKRPARS